MPKPNRKWILCLDFSNSNDACMKDMNSFSDCNQIRIDEKDIVKVSFIIDQGWYCYIVMPFGLKNPGSTHQRLVNKIFKHLIRKNGGIC